VLGPLLNKVLNLVRDVKTNSQKSMAQIKKNLDMDEEDLERVMDELGKQCAASTYVMEISGQLVLNFGPKVTQMVKQNFLTYFAVNLQGYKQLTESELLDATCFFCDFIEYSYHEGEAHQMMHDLAVKYLEIFNGATTDVKQTLAYGLGVFCYHLPSEIAATIVPQTLLALQTMISAPDAFGENLVISTESALGAVGKLIYSHKELIPEGVVLAFLERLPLTHEQEEAQKSHKLFLEGVKAGHLAGDAARAAVARIRQAAATEIDGISILDEEGQALLAQLQ
jgi:hypothetical protein